MANTSVSDAVSDFAERKYRVNRQRVQEGSNGTVPMAEPIPFGLELGKGLHPLVGEGGGVEDSLFRSVVPWHGSAGVQVNQLSTVSTSTPVSFLTTRTHLS